MLGNESETIYGGCEGPDSMYIKLVSCDGHEFIIKRKCALVSPMINNMLSGPGTTAENEINELTFRDISSYILQKVCEYFTYRDYYSESSQDIPEFPIAPGTAVDFLMAANFLDC